MEESVLGLRQHSRILSNLDDGEVALLAPFLKMRKVQKGAWIFKEGDDGDYIAFILRGKIEVRRSTDLEGRPMLMAVLSEGSHLGEFSVLDDNPRSAGALAVEDAELAVLTRDALERFSADYPRAGIKIYRALGRILTIRLRKVIDRVSALS